MLHFITRHTAISGEAVHALPLRVDDTHHSGLKHAPAVTDLLKRGGCLGSNCTQAAGL